MRHCKGPLHHLNTTNSKYSAVLFPRSYLWLLDHIASLISNQLWACSCFSRCCSLYSSSIAFSDPHAWCFWKYINFELQASHRSRFTCSFLWTVSHQPSPPASSSGTSPEAKDALFLAWQNAAACANWWDSQCFVGASFWSILLWLAWSLMIRSIFDPFHVDWAGSWLQMSWGWTNVTGCRRWCQGFDWIREEWPPTESHRQSVWFHCFSNNQSSSYPSVLHAEPGLSTYPVFGSERWSHLPSTGHGSLWIPRFSSSSAWRSRSVIQLYFLRTALIVHSCFGTGSTLAKSTLTHSHPSPLQSSIGTPFELFFQYLTN